MMHGDYTLWGHAYSTSQEFVISSALPALFLTYRNFNMYNKKYQRFKRLHLRIMDTSSSFSRPLEAICTSKWTNTCI